MFDFTSYSDLDAFYMIDYIDTRWRPKWDAQLASMSFCVKYDQYFI